MIGSIEYKIFLSFYSNKATNRFSSLGYEFFGVLSQSDVFRTAIFECKSLFRIEYTYRTILVSHDKIGKEILALLICIFVDERKELLRFHTIFIPPKNIWVFFKVSLDETLFSL